MVQNISAQVEASILSDARNVFKSPLLRQIREAFAHDSEAKVQIGWVYIQFEPDIPAGACSAITDFQGNGFTIGRDAFKSDQEFRKTLLHEIYRLRQSARAPVEAGHELVRSETRAAFDFADRYWSKL